MIDIIVSKVCPQCDAQRTIMQKSFFADEYRIIEVGTSEFENYDLREKIDAVPFIVIRDDNGSVKYADKGKRDGNELHMILRVGKVIESSTDFQFTEQPYNLRAVRTVQSVGRLSRHLDA